MFSAPELALVEVRPTTAALRAVPTERGAMILSPEGWIELRPLCRGAMEWLGSDEQRRPLVRCAQA